MKKVFIIAEAGVNHNGQLALAKELAKAAKLAGADAVKFQTFRTANLVAEHTVQAEYQRVNIGREESQAQMLRRLELSYEEFRELYHYCQEIGILFLSTAFDLESIDFLAGLGMKIWKIPSGEITNLPYLEKIAGLGKPIILSTGMADMQEIKEALQILNQPGAEKSSDFIEHEVAYTKMGRTADRESDFKSGACLGVSKDEASAIDLAEITVLHCTTEYPTPDQDVNLRAMQTMEQELKVAIGYSDHTAGIVVPALAAAMGAEVIEKHFTLDKQMEGPDHKASLEPMELKAMIEAIRRVEVLLGDGHKKPTAAEVETRLVARKCIVAKQPIARGELFSAVNLTVKRAGHGLSPMRWYEIIGRTAERDFDTDEAIEVLL